MKDHKITIFINFKYLILYNSAAFTKQGKHDIFHLSYKFILYTIQIVWKLKFTCDVMSLSVP